MVAQFDDDAKAEHLVTLISDVYSRHDMKENYLDLRTFSLVCAALRKSIENSLSSKSNSNYRSLLKKAPVLDIYYVTIQVQHSCKYIRSKQVLYNLSSCYS